MILDAIPTVPGWIGQIATAAVGALLAYTAWSWLHSPHLAVVDVSNQPVVSVDDRGMERSLRIEIENVGTRAARNCEVTVDLRAPLPDGNLRARYIAPWLPSRSDLVHVMEVLSYRDTIPAGRSLKTEVLRQTRTSQATISAHGDKRVFLRVFSGSGHHRPIEEELPVVFRTPSRNVTEGDIHTMTGISPEVIEKIDWERSKFVVTVETESAQPLEIELDISSEDESNWLSIEYVGETGVRKWSTRFYRAVTRARTAW